SPARPARRSVPSRALKTSTATPASTRPAGTPRVRTSAAISAPPATAIRWSTSPARRAIPRPDPGGTACRCSEVSPRRGHAAASLLRFVGRQAAHVADVEAAVGDDRVGPGGAAEVVDLEPALLGVALGRRFGQGDFVAFAEAVQHAVGVDQRALPHAAGLP